MYKERLWHADVVRVVACVMVVLMHSPMPGDKLIPIFTSGLTYMTMPCIGLFFTLSGFLLLPVSVQPSESSGWVVKRVKKFLWPLILWSLVYLLVSGKLLSNDFGTIVHTLCSIPFAPQEGMLWFMYVLIGLYIVAPIISPWLQEIDKNTLKCYLGIWGFSLLIPYITPLVGIREGVYGMFYYVSGFLGYFLMGYYLRKYDIRINVWKSILGISFCMVMYAIYKVMLEEKGWDWGEVFSYLSIDNPFLVICWWNILRPISNCLSKSKDSVKKVILTTSNLAFGVYLGHILVMRYGLWKLSFIQQIDNYVFQTIVVFVLSFLGTLLLGYVISLTPWGHYIIAYKNKK